MKAHPQLITALAECMRIADERRDEHQRYLDAGQSAERLKLAQDAGIPIGTLVSAFHDLKASGFDIRSAAHLVNYILLAVIAGKQEVSP